MKVRKAVVLAAGRGTRFLPATKAQPKEMLPLVDKPLIHYIVEEVVASGIREIIIVTALGKHALEDYFDRSWELENALKEKGEEGLLAEVTRISDLADFAYVRQKEQLGVGHAVLTVKDLVGHEPFALLFPDDIIHASTPCLGQMVDVFDRFQSSVIAVERVPWEQVERYGVVAPSQVWDRICQIADLVEKPARAEAPSNLAIVGRYILTPDIFAALEETPPGKGGEIQLTDGLRLLLQSQSLYGYEFEGKRYDAGTPLGLLKASVETALGRADIAEEFRSYLKSLDGPWGITGN